MFATIKYSKSSSRKRPRCRTEEHQKVQIKIKFRASMARCDMQQAGSRQVKLEMSNFALQACNSDVLRSEQYYIDVVDHIALQMAALEY